MFFRRGCRGSSQFIYAGWREQLSALCEISPIMSQISGNPSASLRHVPRRAPLFKNRFYEHNPFILNEIAEKYFL